MSRHERPVDATAPARADGGTPGRRRARLRVEPLEDRLAPAGVFNEDFSDDANPAAPGFDTAADGVQVLNDLPRYGTAFNGPTGRGGYYYVQPGRPGDP